MHASRTRFSHVRRRFAMLSRCLSTKFLASELSRKLIKGALLVGSSLSLAASVSFVCIWGADEGREREREEEEGEEEEEVESLKRKEQNIFMPPLHACSCAAASRN